MATHAPHLVRQRAMALHSALSDEKVSVMWGSSERNR